MSRTRHIYGQGQGCGTEGFLVWNWGVCWTDGFSVLNRGVFGVELMDFKGWKGVALLCGTEVLNWGGCGTEGNPWSRDKFFIVDLTFSFIIWIAFWVVWRITFICWYFSDIFRLIFTFILNNNYSWLKIVSVKWRSIEKIIQMVLLR